MKITRKHCLIPLTLLTLVAGCASEPTVGDLISRHGKNYEDIGKQWNKGNDMLVRGQELVKKGQQQVIDGNENIEDGEELINKGKRLVEASEKRFADSKSKN
tara:strand:- start:75 stop:380 length:306 start_codon:yes stop_codon:yes gene_type:complete